MNMGTWGSSPYKWSYMPIYISSLKKLAEACRYLNLLGRHGASLSFLKCSTLKVGWVASQGWRPRELQLAGGLLVSKKAPAACWIFFPENSWNITITRDDQCTMVLYPMYISDICIHLFRCSVRPFGVTPHPPKQQASTPTAIFGLDFK